MKKPNPAPAENRLGTLFAGMQQQPTSAPPKRQSTPAPIPAQSTPDTIPSDRRAGGRKRKYTERITTLSLSIAPEHVRYIDAISDGITRSTGKPCGRGEIVRAVIDALVASGLDLSRVAGSEEIRSILTTRLREV